MGGQYVPLGYRVAEEKKIIMTFSFTMKILGFPEKHSAQPDIIFSIHFSP